MPWSLADHGPSAQSVPMTASAKNAIGRKQAGCLRERRNECGSMVGITTKNQTIIKIATAVVDHGMEAATRTGYMSTQKSQNEDRVADKKSEETLPRCCVDSSAASSMLIQLRLMSLARSFGPSPLARRHNPAARKGLRRNNVVWPNSRLLSNVGAPQALRKWAEPVAAPAAPIPAFWRRSRLLQV